MVYQVTPYFPALRTIGYVFGCYRKSGTDNFLPELMKEKDMEDEYSDQKAQEIEEQVSGWLKNFVRSVEFKQLERDEQGDVDSVVRTYAEFMYSYFLREPQHWTQTATIELLKDIFPRKILNEGDFFDHVKPGLIQFFRWLGRMNLLDNTAVLITGVEKINKTMIERSQEPIYWGPAKQVGQLALDEGIDLMNDNALGKFIDKMNMATGATKRFNQAKLETETSKNPKDEKQRSHNQVIAFPKNKQDNK